MQVEVNLQSAQQHNVWLFTELAYLLATPITLVDKDRLLNVVKQAHYMLELFIDQEEEVKSKQFNGCF